MAAAPSIHASCVLVGATAVLIRGPSGSGKSRLTLQILQAAERDILPFARLVSDDRTLVEAAHDRLLARPAPELSGRIELRQIGIRTMPVEPVALVGLVVDQVEGAARMPEKLERMVEIAGITLPRLAVPSLPEAMPLVLAELADLAARRRDLICRPALSEK
ncbi:MAG: HPr kinase/phosphorylase [Xanthobacteraceae bacterium]